MNSQGQLPFTYGVNDYSTLFGNMVNDNMLADSMFSNNGYGNDPLNNDMIGDYMTDEVVRFVGQSLEVLGRTVDGTAGRPIVIDNDEATVTAQAEPVTVGNTAVSVNWVTDVSPADSVIDLTDETTVIQPQPEPHKGTPLFTPYHRGPDLERFDQMTRAIGKRKRKDWEGPEPQYVPSPQACRPKKRKANQVDDPTEPAAKRSKSSSASPAVEQGEEKPVGRAAAAIKRAERKAAAQDRNRRQKAVAAGAAAPQVTAATNSEPNSMLPISAEQQTDMAAAALKTYNRSGLVLPGLDPQVQMRRAAQSMETVRRDPAVALPAEAAATTTTADVVATPTDEQLEKDDGDKDDTDKDSLFGQDFDYGEHGNFETLFAEVNEEEAVKAAAKAEQEREDIDEMMRLAEEQREEEAAEKFAAEQEQRRLGVAVVEAFKEQRAAAERERQAAAEKEEKKQRARERANQRQRERRAEERARKEAAEREKEEQVLAAKKQAEEDANALAAKAQADEEARRQEEIRQREIDEYESDADDDELPKLVKTKQAASVAEAPKQVDDQERQVDNDEDSGYQSEYSDDGEDDEDAADAMDTDATARMVERQQQLEEVAGLEKDVASKKNNVEAQTNQLLKKVGLTQLRKMEEALQAKRMEYGLVENDSKDKMEGLE